MIGKLLKFPKKTNIQDVEFQIAQIELGPNKLEKLKNLLLKLKRKEQAMVNPILKDWFAIRNNIRAVERKIRELNYGNNS